jgi:adenosylhomocysteine nucleosidase
VNRSSALLFIAAEPREFSGFLRHITNLAPTALPVHWSRRGSWKQHDVVLIANGAGPDQSAAAARAFDSPAAIISTGFCGALDSELKIGDVIVADRVFFSTQMFDCRPVTTSESFRHGAICSSARIVATAKEKEQLHRSGAIAVEMEAGGIAPYAQDRGLPLFCIRAVSDLADESFSNDFNAALGPDGRYRVGQLIGSALMRPHRRFPELMRLKQRCDRAAERLGTFLDSCSF